LTALRRVSVGSLQIADALTLDQLNALPEADRSLCLLAPDALLQTLPAVHLDAKATLRFSHGNAVSIAGSDRAMPGKCRVYGEQGLLGLGETDASGNIHPRRLVCA